MKKNSIFIYTLFALQFIACGSPIANAENEKKPNSQNAKTLAAEDSPNLLKAYGCPNAFSDLKLCVRVEWFDDQNQAVEKPIYWQKYRDHAMQAKLSFWSSEDGWPIDPRAEYPEAKIIQVKLFMATMGHGSMGLNPRVTEMKNRAGQFKVENIHFVMKGSEKHPWDFRIQLKTEHNDDDFDSAEEAAHEPHVWKQSILQFIDLDQR